MALLNVTINGTERQIDTDDLTIGFYEDLEQAQATGKMRDFIPVLAAMLQIDRAEVREITLKQWKEIASSFERAVAVPPTNA
jgi:hypothetical protein